VAIAKSTGINSLWFAVGRSFYSENDLLVNSKTCTIFYAICQRTVQRGMDSIFYFFRQDLQDWRDFFRLRRGAFATGGHSIPMILLILSNFVLKAWRWADLIFVFTVEHAEHAEDYFFLPSHFCKVGENTKVSFTQQCATYKKESLRIVAH